MTSLSNRETPRTGDILSAINSRKIWIYSLILDVRPNLPLSSNVVKITVYRFFDRWHGSYPICLDYHDSKLLHLYRDGNQLW